MWRSRDVKGHQGRSRDVERCRWIWWGFLGADLMRVRVKYLFLSLFVLFFLLFKFLFFNFLNPHSKARKVKISIFLTLPYITLPDSYLMEDRPAYRYCVVLHALDTYLPAWSWASHHPWNNLHKLFFGWFFRSKT